jgi:hypothetical protein
MVQALREIPPDQSLAVADGFIRVLVEDGMLPRWHEVEAELVTGVTPRSGTVARANEAGAVVAALGPGADVRIDPQVIGGAVLRRGDTLVDNSVAGRLRQMSQLIRAE